MKQIEQFSLHNLRNAETFGYLTLMSEQTSLLTLPSDAQRVQAFVAAVNELEELTKPNRKNSFTKVRIAADLQAKNLYSGLWFSLKGATYSPNSSQQQTAKKIFERIKSYKLNSQSNYVHRYPKLAVMINELEELPAKVRNELGLNQWIEGLQTAYDDFIIATDNSITEESHRQVGIVTEKRKATQQAYYDFVTYINAGVWVNGEQPYTEFINSANVLVSEYKAHLAARQTRKTNKRNKAETISNEEEVVVQDESTTLED